LKAQQGIQQNDKARLRKTSRQLRNQLSSTQQEAAKHALLHVLTANSVFKNSKKVALYLSNDGELDTSLVIDYCWQQGISVYLPVLHPFSKGHLLFLEYNHATPMVHNQFGIEEPQLNVNTLCLLNDLDIIFTPLVAFDLQGDRLGMGGGFYDRTLAISQKHTNLSDHAKRDFARETKNINVPVVIGLAHDCQQVDKIPTQSWDIKIPFIATPSKFYQC